MKNTSTTPHSLFLSAICAALVGGLAALPASAQTYPATSPRQPAKVNDPVKATDPATPTHMNDDYTTGTKAMKPDRHTEKVINKISMLSSEQLRLAQIASQRATNTQVRTLAQQVQTCSQDLQQSFDQLAQKNSLLVPTGKHANDVADDEQKWQKKDGKDFDGDYVKRVIKDTKESIDALEDYSKVKNADPEIVALGEKHLPTLRENLSQAEALKKQVD
jgi:predicted outer membrane protein